MRRLRGISFLYLGFGPFRTVLRTALFAVRDSGGIKRAPYDVIADAGQIFHAAAANQHNRVLLQIVADARNVRGDLDPVRQPDARHLPQRRIWLLWRRSVHSRTNTAFLR